MEAIFIKLLNMSITAGYIIAAVVIFRLIFRKAPKWIHCLFWGIAGIRLVFPFTLKSKFSLIPKSEVVSIDILQINSLAVDNILNTAKPAMDYSAEIEISTGNLSNFMHLAAIIWFAGMVILILYGIVSYILLSHKVNDARQQGNNILISNKIASPFILGIFKPRIYLPFNIDNNSIPFVIAHEKAHLKRRDHWIKPIGFVLLAVYWFNPLVWIAYILLCRDIELACDEAVIKKLGETQKKYYSKALLDCSLGRRSIAACPLAFGEVGIKSRIKNVLNYKKPAFWVIVIAVIVSIIVAAVFLTNPKDDSVIEIPVGTYAFEECIYINPLSSYIPFEGTGELYKITKSSLIIVNKGTGETTTEIVFDNVKSSSFTDEEWSDLFIFDLFTEDIRKLNYKERIMWELSDEFRLYEMDDEIWLMRLAGKNGVWSIYSLKPDGSVNDSSESSRPEFWDPTYNLENVDSLDRILPHIIYIENQNNFDLGEIATTAYTILKKEETGNILIIYAMAMYQEFNYTNGQLIETGGIHSPVVITLEKGDNGGYGVEEYWIPDDGAGYLTSLNQKFPPHFNLQLLDTQKYVKLHLKTCYESAVAQSGMDVNARIAELIDIICSSPLYSSNSNDYLKAHETEYIELQNYGVYTLQYCFGLFKEGGQTGLKGHIMASACREILMGSETSEYEIEYTTGQDWYEEITNILH